MYIIFDVVENLEVFLNDIQSAHLECPPKNSGIATITSNVLNLGGHAK